MSQLETTVQNQIKRQQNDNNKKAKYSRSGRGTVQYWKGRLFKNKVWRKNGIEVIPEYYVRLRHDGVTKRVHLSTSDKDLAADEALGLSIKLAKDGWGVINDRLDRKAVGLTVDEFCNEYRKAAEGIDNPPRPISINQYVRHLKQICTLADVKTMRDLTANAIDKARDKYKLMARAEQRSEASIQNSLGIIIRNAAACFSKRARNVYRRNGIDYENPFIGISKPQKIEPVAAINQDVMLKIWKDLPLLRDGDPNVITPDRKKYATRYRKAHNGKDARWFPIDYSKPHPDAYCAILLALGLGMRRNEIDKARWSWLKYDSKGNCVLEIRHESDFTPKGGTNRFVRIPNELHLELEKARVSLDSPYVLGGAVKDNPKVFGYRRRSTLRIASEWLRDHGIETGKLRGNPLHRLRKQFGSEVATSFGLFQAQKLLGHSSPTVTAKYYAAQTNLPELTHVRILG